MSLRMSKYERFRTGSINSPENLFITVRRRNYFRLSYLILQSSEIFKFLVNHLTLKPNFNQHFFEIVLINLSRTQTSCAALFNPDKRGVFARKKRRAPAQRLFVFLIFLPTVLPRFTAVPRRVLPLPWREPPAHLLDSCRPPARYSVCRRRRRRSAAQSP